MRYFFDGAMGTMLQSAGIKPGESPELWNMTHPDKIEAVHTAYIEAGSTIITTNTFGAGRYKLAHYSLGDKLEEINVAAVRIAKKAAKGLAKVAGGLSPTGKFIEPLGDLSFDDAYDAFYEQAAILLKAGVDYIIIETIIDLQEMRAALIAAKEARDEINKNVPIIAQFSYSEDGRTVTGTDPKTAAIVCDALGADVIGMNCSLGPEQLLPLVKIIAQNTNKPISVQPNAGLPCLEDGKTIFPMTPDDFAHWVPSLIEAGATYLGGCCGTTPAHIRALTKAAKDVPDAKREYIAPKLHLTSRSKTVTIDKDENTVLIGERINPTGRKKLAAEIKDGSLLSVKKEALDQTRAGASVLDVNLGVAGIDQAKMMRRVITELSQLTSAPLVIDTSDEKVLEAGLRIYPGRALINSVSAETERIEKFLPLAKKYGAAILCLPLTDDGVPKSVSERVCATDTIISEAKKHGLRDGDFLLDALVMTVAADKTAATQTLETLRRYREKYSYPTTMGLSNISFGLPNRALINSTFFAMSLLSGLDAPIMNPYDEDMQRALIASAALLGKDENARRYSKDERNLAVSAAPAVFKVLDLSPLAAIKEAVINGEKELIEALIEKAVKEGHTTSEITDEALTAAMNDIGEDFGNGKVFLPQVLLSAETMRVAVNELKKLLPAQTGTNIGKVVIATVKGDVHDLGKNIVAALLSNSGFAVTDLGKDVSAEAIVAKALDEGADIVGLCALMTTTMPQLDIVIAELKKAGASAKVIVGGAAVTDDYAQSAGADAYAPDGVAAVKIAKSIITNSKKE